MTFTPRRCSPLHRFALTAALSLAVGVAFSQTTPGTDPRRSGFDFMGATTQAMQKDDPLNPGMLWVSDGEALWKRPAGQSRKACITCHAPAASSMRGAAARYPAFDEVLNARSTWASASTSAGKNTSRPNRCAPRARSS